jgi:hypothetical protein
MRVCPEAGSHEREEWDAAKGQSGTLLRAGEGGQTRLIDGATFVSDTIGLNTNREGKRPMKKKIMLGGIVLFFLFQGISLAQTTTPHQVAGFILGKNIADHKGMVKMETSIPIRYMGYVNEVEISKIGGFKSGLIAYGNCVSPGRIVRIKLKYADSSKKFYNYLFKRFKVRFGKPTEWRGDSFHVLTAWKWSFSDQENNRISMILQHNTKDEEQKIGNSLKLTMTNLFEEERVCFERKERKAPEEPDKSNQGKGSQDPAYWDRFIPR